MRLRLTPQTVHAIVLAIGLGLPLPLIATIANHRELPSAPSLASTAQAAITGAAQSLTVRQYNLGGDVFTTGTFSSH